MLMQLSIELVFIILVKPLWTAVHVVTNRTESVGRQKLKSVTMQKVF